MHLENNMYKGRPPQKPELCCGGQAPYSTGYPCVVSVLGTPLYQCSSCHCCERLLWASVNILKALSMHSPFMIGDLRAHRPTLRWTFNSFWPKTSWPLCPIPLIYPTAAQATFVFFPWMKKVLRGKCFTDVEEVEQKTAEALKGIRINKFKNCFEQWKKCLNRCIVSNGKYFEGDWSLNMWE